MADKTFRLEFDVDANITPIKTKVKDLETALQKVNLSNSSKKNIDSIATKLKNEIKQFESIVGKDNVFTNTKQFSDAEKSYQKIINLINRLGVESRSIQGIPVNKLLPPEIGKNLTEVINKFEKLNALSQNYQQIATYKEKSDQLEQLEARRRKLSSEKGLNTRYNNQWRQGKLSNEQLDEKRSLHRSTEEINKELTEVRTQIAATKKEMTDLEGILGDQVNAADDVAKAYKETYSEIETDIEKVRNEIVDFAKLQGIDLKLEDIPKDLEGISDVLNSITKSPISGAMSDLNEAATEAANTLQQVEKQEQDIVERSRELEQVANQVKQFFSVGNTVQLFKRAIRSAFDTIKELDAVMTQTAVVTDFTVGDMWAQLPEYTKRANELGVSVKGAYEAATLYYQQGLETNEVIGVSNETLKMAKIAGIDYATATDYMTSALRGFNMEVNEASAQKINDVYSLLAAKTAADTEEISIAMSKTAPLAHNAGMEIETTAALLSQMIETTREAPETLGTAMKTVIARFQELKKDPALIEPVEGEIVDANKIEAALRTIGVALRDTEGQFRDLDDVFLEISQKWDSLDTNTQRYIATIAAGSRQQSRFIAMMANYDRTVELVSMANNAAGASQQQFEKTLESMQSKLDRLKNAWNEYTMGIANNTIIKAAIDLLTKFLNMINKLSSAASGKKGIFKSLIDIGLLMGGLKLAKAAFNGFFGWLTKGTSLAGKVAGDTFGKGFSKGIDGSINKLKGNINKIKNLFSKTTWIDKSAVDGLDKYNKTLKELSNIKWKKGENSNYLPSPKEIKEVTNAEQAYQASLKELGSTLKLTNDEMKVAEVLTEAGVDADLANIAAVNGLTEAEAKELISKEGITAATIEEKIATDAETQSEILNARAKNQGLIGQVKLLGQMLFSTSATKRQAAANVFAAGTFKSLSTAMKALPFGWILAGIAAVVAAIKIVQALSLGARIERAAEATKRAKEIADDTKQAYNDLLSSRSEYNNLQETLDGLTYGTQAWKEALIETNQEVLELLQTFPQLAQYLERSRQGRLSISDEGWDAVIDNQLRQVNIAAGGVVQSQLKEGYLNELKLQKELQKDLNKVLNPEVGREVGFGIKTYEKELRALLDAGITTDLKSNLEKTFGMSLKASEEDLQKAAQAILKYDAAVQANQLQMENSAEAFLSSALDQDLYSELGDAADGIIKVFAQQMVDSANDTENNSGEILLKAIGYTGQRSKLERQYAELMGMTIDEVKDLDKNKRELIEAIQKAEKSDKIISAFEEYAEWVANSTEEGVRTVTGILGENFENFDSSELEKIAKGSGSLESLADSLKLDEDSLKKTIIGLGYVMDDGTADFKAFAEDFGDSIQLMIDQIHQSRVDLIQSMMDTGIFGTQGIFKNSNELQAYLNNLTDQQVVGLSQMMDNISSLSDENQQYIFSKVKRSKDLEESVDFINSIDFSDPISALVALQKEAEKTGSAFSLMSQEIIELEPELFSTSNLFKSFVQSTDFEDLNDELKEFVDNEGKISPANIKELAKSSDRLNDLLKTGKISAGALAKAFTAFETAGIPVDHFTDRVLEALLVTEDFEDTLYELQDIYSNFDPGLDENFGVNFLSDALEKMQEYAANGQYNNSAFKEYFKEVFGEDALNQALNEVLEGGNPQAIFGRYLNQLSGDLSSEGWGFWDRLVGQSSNGIQVLADAAGNIILDTGHKTTEQVEEELANMAGVSLDTAKAMLAMYREYSFDIDAQLNQNDYLARLEKLKESGGGVITEQEVQAYAVSIDSTPEQVKADLDGSIQVVDWFDTSGLPKFGVDLERQIGQVIKDVDFGGKGKDFEGLYNYLKEAGAISQEQIDGIETLTVDYQKLTEAATEYLGISEEQAKQESPFLANQLLNVAKGQLQDEELQLGAVKLSAEVEIPGADENGVYTMETKLVYADDANDLQANIDANLEAADYGIIATEIAGLDLSKMTTNVQNSISTGATKGINAANSKIRNWQIPSKTLNLKVNVNKSGIPVWLRPLLDSGVAQVTGTDNGDRTTPRGTVLASGTGPSGLSRKETALTGEEGYELAYDSHGAFILGANGPEIADLEKGTVVFPHDESKKILKGSKKKKFSNYAGGNDGGLKDLADGLAHSTRPNNTKNNNNGNGTITADNLQVDSPKTEVKTKTTETTTEEPETWENPYDELHNLLKNINAELRYRETLERRYQQTLEDLTKSGKDLLKNQDEQRAALDRREKREYERISGRQNQVALLESQNSDLYDYVHYDPISEEMWIDWKKIEELSGKTDSASVELGKRIQEQYDKESELIEDIKDAEDDLIDIEETRKELEERGKDQYKEYEDKVLQGLIQRQQDIIDNQEKINESIDEANSDLVSTMEANISKMRQDRENQEKEESLLEKQRRLAYLQQDTTGGNALEIKKLQKELDKERQDYQDTLIDQSLNDLKEQNKEASEQRKRQIDIMQSQLNYWIDTGYFNTEATKIVREGLKDGLIDTNSDLYEILKEVDDVEKISNASREQWLDMTASGFKEAYLWVMNHYNGNGVDQSMIWSDEMIIAADHNNPEALRSAEESRNQVVREKTLTKDDFTKLYEKGKQAEVDPNIDYKALINEALNAGNYELAAELAGTRDAKIEKYNRTEAKDSFDQVYDKYQKQSLKETQFYQAYTEGRAMEPDPDVNYWDEINGAIATKKSWYEVAKLAGLRDAKILKYGLKVPLDSLSHVIDLWTRITHGTKFKNGGLANFTGPAWLDGSKSRPEAILSAKDTENFIQLKNILSDLRNTIPNNNTLGDWYFDIDINVDEISNDYDVDSMVRKVKRSIYEESIYRNVNAINFLK